MFRFAITTLLFASTAAIAQDTTVAPATEDKQAAEAQQAAQDKPAAFQADGPLISAEAVEDARVYSLNEDYNETFWNSGEAFGDVAASWLEIGDVEDLVLDNEAKVVGVTVDVGGFLGIADRDVLIPLEHLRLVQGPGADDFMIVTRMTEAQLEEAEDVGPLVGKD
ncbi:PRC-barrel domain-containing protein [Pseudooceanicola sp.]|uniref:PRC-barrel domain-containing protein n=1 Tax=Pseudooceanicola sp. TaxID=1914328 RepID=UPI0035C78821